jgi:hypothetical protein
MSAYPNSNLNLPSINQDFIDLSGCNVIDLLPIDDKQKELLNKAISGELFINPVQSLITEAFNTVGEFVDEVQGAVAGQFKDNIQRMVDAAGNRLPGVNLVPTFDIDPETGLFFQRPENVLEFIERKSNQINAGISYFQQQTEILSGTSLLPKDQRASDFDYNSDGGIDEFPGLVGITNIAQGFQQTTNSLDPDNLEDRFSGFFDSVTGKGGELMEGVNAAARGDIGEALSIFRGADGSISIPQNSNNNDGGFDLVQIVDAYESVQSAVETIEALVNNERALTALATDYLTKTVFGFSVLALLADPCFGKKIAEKIFAL